MTSELVPWRGRTVPLLAQGEISRFDISSYLQLIQQGGYGTHSPIPVQTTYGRQAQEPIANNFQGFVEGLLYSDGPVAAVTAYRLRVFSQAPMLFRRKDGTRPGDYYDDPSLDQLRRPWPGGSLGDLMKLALIHSDFAGNAFVVRIEDELVCLRPDWVKIVLERRMYGGVQVGWRQMGIAYVENGNYGDVDFNSPEIATFLPGEYAHFKSAFPDPLANYRGMSWLTPIVKEVMSDKAATLHKLKYFENSATPNLAVKTPAAMTPEQFKAFVSLMREQHDGVENAYRTLYLGDGADVSVIGGNMQQMDFAAVQGKIETRIANGGGIHAVLIGFSEGMQGSSLNAGNYGAAKRNTTDTTIRDLWRNWCSSMQELFPPPDPADELSYDERDIPYLHEDQQDEASVRQTDAATISSLITSGFEPDSVTAAVMANDWSLLKHTGLTSVQLLPPGARDTDGDGSVDVTDETVAEEDAAEDSYLEALQASRSEVALWQLEDVIARAGRVEDLDDDDDDELGRADYYDVRNPKGTVGGGRFRKISAVITDALSEWMRGDGPGDPLEPFTREQLRTAGIQQGLTFRRGASADEIKLALLNKARADRRAEREAPKVEAPPDPEQEPDEVPPELDREQAERLLKNMPEHEMSARLTAEHRTKKDLVKLAGALGLAKSGTRDQLTVRIKDRAAELRNGPDVPRQTEPAPSFEPPKESAPVASAYVALQFRPEDTVTIDGRRGTAIVDEVRTDGRLVVTVTKRLNRHDTRIDTFTVSPDRVSLVRKGNREEDLANLFVQGHDLAEATRLADAKHRREIAAAKKAAPRVPKESSADVAAKLNAATSRDDAHDALKGKTRVELVDIAKAAGVHHAANASKGSIEKDLVQHTVGRRLTSDAILGRVAGSGAAKLDPAADFRARAGFTERQKRIDMDVRAAYESLKGRTDLPEGATSNAGVSIHAAMRKGGYVALADLRDELGEKYNRHELDEVLKAIAIHDESAVVIPETYQWGLLPRDRDSELVFGDQAKHWLKLEGPQVQDAVDERTKSRPRGGAVPATATEERVTVRLPYANLTLDELEAEFASESAKDNASESALWDLYREMSRREQVDIPQVDIEQRRRVDELLASGMDYRQAYAEAYDLSEDDLARQELASLVDQSRAGGETRDQTVRRLYSESVALSYLQAEQFTRGHMLSPLGRSARIDPQSLFHGTRDRARKYASEELKRFWENNPRQTLVEFRAMMLGRDRDKAQARKVRQQGQDKDFGL